MLQLRRQPSPIPCRFFADAAEHLRERCRDRGTRALRMVKCCGRGGADDGPPVEPHIDVSLSIGLE
jgi:hypothetical protein